MLIFLTGFMGCGKSTDGKTAAKLLKVPFLDLDLELEKSSGQSVYSFIKTQGIRAFRQFETETLLQTYQILQIEPCPPETPNPKPQAIIATGGGCVLSEDNCKFLMQPNHSVVWLDLPFEVLIPRIRKSDRPLLQGLNEDEIYKLFKTRLHIYESVASHRITEPPFPEQICSLFTPIA